MNLNSRISIGLRKFFKKYGKIIVIIFVIWLIIFAFNQFLKNRPKEISLINTYAPDKAVIDDGGDVPKRKREDVKNTINTFLDYCNDKQYGNAYDMLTEDAKLYLYDNDLLLFKEYVDKVFNTKKIYNYQNFSNFNDTYIYDLTVLDDIEATGTSTGYDPYVEKIAVRKVDDKYLISNQGFIETKDYNITAENDNIRVDVLSKDMSYAKEGYNVVLTNKTDKYIVILDNSLLNEITLNLGDQKRKITNYSNASIILNPGQTRTDVFIFDKFYDDNKDPSEISLENVRILDNYDFTMEETEDYAERMYSFNISLKK